jgi:hypothetical protein
MFEQMYNAIVDAQYLNHTKSIAVKQRKYCVSLLVCETKKLWINLRSTNKT